MLSVVCIFAAWSLLGTVGCFPPSKQAPPPTASKERPPRVLVVDDSKLATAISQAWTATTEGEVEVQVVSAEKLATAKRLPADILVFPTDRLGELAQKELIVPAPTEVLNDADWNRRELFDTARRQEIQWGRETFALPLGFPPLVLAYRADLMQKKGLKSAETWTDFQNIGTALSAGEDKFSGTAIQFPLAEGEAAGTFLAWAAPYVADGTQLAVLFDRDSLQPLLAEPPYVRALTELVAAARSSGDPPAIRSSREIWEDLHAGKIGCALTRVSRGETAAAKEIVLDIAPLPGTTEGYRFATASWITKPELGRARIVGEFGTLVSVTADAYRPTKAWAFAAWLTSAETTNRLAPHSQRIAPFRHSQQSNLAKWVDARLTADAAGHYFEILRGSEKAEPILFIPRLPQWQEYQAALDAGVRRAVLEQQDPAAVLQDVSARWREITRTAGEQQQRKAYQAALDGATR